MSICKNFEVCKTRYIFSKPYENHKNHHNLLLQHFFTNLVLRIVGLDETFHLLENYENSKVYKTRYEKTKNHKYTIFEIIVVVAMVTCLQICTDT